MSVVVVVELSVISGELDSLRNYADTWSDKATTNIWNYTG